MNFRRLFPNWTGKGIRGIGVAREIKELSLQGGLSNWIYKDVTGFGLTAEWTRIEMARELEELKGKRGYRKWVGRGVNGNRDGKVWTGNGMTAVYTGIGMEEDSKGNGKG